MALHGSIEIPTMQGTISIEFRAGSSIVFVGANGTGKTRLGVLLENSLPKKGIEAHRIAAHRSLTLNPHVVPPSLETANNRLFYGTDDGNVNLKYEFRYNRKPETGLLNDFDHVLSALYAENNDISVKFRQNARSAPSAGIDAPLAKIDIVQNIWEKVLPHRQIIVIGSGLKTKTLEGDQYSASDMSDGERVTFYLIAQALLAKPNSVLIFDEPELHINRSILAKLWDEIESERSDCCFLYITHDVEFGGSRRAATKYALRNYRKVPIEAWDIELVPQDGEMPEDLVVAIVGSRRPVLFVEGDRSSLDSSLYSRIYDDFTVIPVGPCEQVVQAVAAFSARPQLHMIGCAGLVDADGRTDEEAARLASKGVYRLPVSEVENLLLLPHVFLALAAAIKFPEADAQAKLSALRSIILARAAEHIDAVCLRYTKRRVDAKLKKLGLPDTNINELDAALRQAAVTIDPIAIFNNAKAKFETAINSRDYDKVLLHYDNKGLLAEAAKQLGYQSRSLEAFVVRLIRSEDGSEFRSALTRYLPTVTPRR
jgi:hypothetical protein